MLKKKTRIGGITIMDFKPYYKAAIIKAVWHWTKTDTQIDGTEQRTQKWTHNSHQLILDKAGKNIQRKKTVSSTNGVGKTGQPHAEE